MKQRRLYDFFNDLFERYLPQSVSQQAAYNKATDRIWDELKFVPYSSFESFIQLRKRKKKLTSAKKLPITTNH